METDAYDDDLPACASCEDAQKDYDNLEMVANNLAAIVRRLAHALRDVSPTHDLPGKALDYLKREGFAGQPIRKVGAGETAVQGDMLLPANVRNEATAAPFAAGRLD